MGDVSLNEPFLSDDTHSSLLDALNEMQRQHRQAVQYSAHLSALLREACDILEKMEVEVEVSEPLQFWWEKEKRKREAKAGGLVVVGDRGPLRNADGSIEGSCSIVDDESTGGPTDSKSVELIVP